MARTEGGKNHNACYGPGLHVRARDKGMGMHARDKGMCMRAREQAQAWASPMTLLNMPRLSELNNMLLKDPSEKALGMST